MKLSSCSLILISALALGHSAQAEIYKWIDPDGETHYSERKPAGDVSFETITPWTEPTAERETLEARLEAFDQRQKERHEQDDKDREAASDVAKIQHNCEQATIRAASLERPRINKINADGTRSRMPEEWRVEQLQEARAAVEKYCN